MVPKVSVGAFALVLARCVAHGFSPVSAQSPDGEVHALRDRSPQAIVEALTGGAMRCQGILLGGAERRAIAEYLTGRKRDIRGFSSATGAIVWEFDTNREFDTVNGVKAHGGSMNGPAPIVVGGMVYVNSGYGALGSRTGNVLLAFGLL